ncbi:ankyrin [Sodiomyces alkalinus F11]|uniref:Ankyrin n=1 Tax=Sodiomyces alkalinus (strain CBS 110278 / VKM F-3762 / F11) TaxID=1314773 RepID=A0A3N2PWN4_SODAK|nr:ankyrin [Sodiomyces alkalinus F11]ROT38917.1 ankyrin [Sodiomyces alkalinus F11]
MDIRQKTLVAVTANGVTNLARALLNRGEHEDIEATLERKTFLAMASKGGHDAVIELLMERGATLDTVESDTERAAVLLAVVGGHESSALILLNHGARPDSVDKSTGRSLLSWASGLGMEKLVGQLLCRHNVHVNTKDLEGRTPISWAAEGGHLAVVQLLLDNKADPDSVGRGLTPRGFATKQGHVAVVRLLTDFGVKLDGEDLNEDRYPILLAAKGSHTAVVQELAGRGGVSPAARSAAVVSAAMNGDLLSILALLEAGVELAPPSPLLRTAISGAVKRNHLQVLRELLSKGVPPGAALDTCVYEAHASFEEQTGDETLENTD